MFNRSAKSAIALRVNERIFYGWVMLGVGGLGIFASGPGQSHLFSVFVTPMSEDLGLNRTSVSSAYAAATLVASFGLPYVGRLIDRHGVERVAPVVAGLLGLAACSFSGVSNLALLTLGFGALRFLGQGSLMLSCNNLASQWFARKRGFALGLMALGFSVSMAAHPALAQYLIDTVGWREAWIWLGVITWALLLPPFVFLLHGKPEALGLRPDGDASVDDNGARSSSDALADVGLTLREAMRTAPFWIIAAGLACLSSLITALFFHQVSIFETQGLNARAAATMFAVSAATMVVVMPLIGKMLDRFPANRMFACAVLSQSVSLLAMTFVDSLASAVAYAVVFGLNNAAIHTHYTFMWPRFFGRRHLGAIQGTAQTIGVMAASLGPLPLGYYFDLTGSYTGILVALAALPLIPAALSLTMSPPVATLAQAAAEST
ncbi:MAG: MFS transporter [Gammaproteobacteria bacterium]